jgi:hypothetical protein
MDGDSYFSDIGIYVLRPRINLTATQIIGNIEKALNNLTKKAGKSGAAVTVLMPTFSVPVADTPGPSLDERITVRVQESPLFNMNAATGTMKSAEAISIQVLQLFHFWNPGGGTWYPDQDALSPSVEFDPKVTYDVSFRRPVNLTGRSKSAMPLIDPEEGAAPQLVTLAAAPGAAICYTLDGTLPVPGHAGTTLYAAPFNVLTAATLRVVAYEVGKAASNVTTAIFS